MTPTTKEEAKTNKLNTSPLNFSHENAEEEAHKRKMRMEKYNVNGGSSGPGQNGGGGPGFQISNRPNKSLLNSLNLDLDGTNGAGEDDYAVVIKVSSYV